MKLFSQFLLLFFFFSQLSAQSGTRCIECCEQRAEDRKTVSVILSGIAQIANGLALIFGKPDKESVNEGVCNLIAGACTVAAQASRSNSTDDTPADLYAILSEPAVLEAVIEILKNEGIAIDPEQLQKNLEQLNLF